MAIQVLESLIVIGFKVIWAKWEVNWEIWGSWDAIEAVAIAFIARLNSKGRQVQYST